MLDDVTYDFADNDSYLTWVRANPGGWVIAAWRAPGSPAPLLHHAWCPRISAPLPQGKRYVSINVVKAGSDTREDAIAYSRRMHRAEPARCEWCKP